jgi:hypothetical protein
VLEINQKVAIAAGYDAGWVERNPNSVPNFLEDWSETGPLIEKFKTDILTLSGGRWWCGSKHKNAVGDTLLEAVCNCLVERNQQ